MYGCCGALFAFSCFAEVVTSASLRLADVPDLHRRCEWSQCERKAIADPFWVLVAAMATGVAGGKPGKSSEVLSDGRPEHQPRSPVVGRVASCVCNVAPGEPSIFRSAVHSRWPSQARARSGARAWLHLDPPIQNQQPSIVHVTPYEMGFQSC